MQLNGRKTDKLGNVIFSQDGLIDHLMRGNDISELFADDNDSIRQFNELCKMYDHPEDQLNVYEKPNQDIESWDSQNQKCWFMPEDYSEIDLEEYFLRKCDTDEQVQRVNEELLLFKERNMENVLRFLIFMIDDFRKRKIVWGVGRGSSVASYCLYLIGVHKIDSLKFNLDPREFLK